MKKLLCIIMSALFIFTLLPIAATAETADRLTMEYNSDTGTVTVEYSADVSDAEEAIRQTRELMLKKYTEEELEAIPALAAFTKPVSLYLVLTYGDENAYIKLDGTEGKTDLSLYGDILSAFPDDADFSDGAVISAEIIPATEGYPGKYSMSFNSVKVTTDDTVTVVPTGRIVYDIPDGSVNTNPSFFTLPLENPVTLSWPALTGGTFSGWTHDGTAISEIPAGTVNMTVKAEFIPNTYNINYVLTTGSVHYTHAPDNTANPTTYSYGTAVKLSSIKSTVGGYTFYGWYLENGEYITEIPAGTMGDILIYAKWVTEEDLEILDTIDDMNALLENHFGDLDSDYEITVADARLALRMAVKLDAYTSETKRRADVNATGTVTVEDARQVLRIAIEIDNNIIELYRAAVKFYNS